MPWLFVVIVHDVKCQLMEGTFIFPISLTLQANLAQTTSVSFKLKAYTQTVIVAEVLRSASEHKGITEESFN